MPYEFLSRLGYLESFEDADESNMTAMINHNSPEYRDYMNSYDWRLKKSQALGQYGGACAACHTKRSLDVHHKTYINWRNESLGDLVVLCRDCHDGVHAAWSKVKAGGPTSRSLAEITEDYIQETHAAAAHDKTQVSATQHVMLNKPVMQEAEPKSKLFLIPKILLSVLLSIVFFELIVFVLLFVVQGSKAFETLHLWNAALLVGTIIGTVIGLPAGIIRGFRQIRRERATTTSSDN